MAAKFSTINRAFLVALAACIVPLSASASDKDAALDCVRAVTERLQGMLPPHRNLSDEDLLLAGEIDRRASALAVGFTEVIQALRTAGMDSDAFADEGRSWVGVLAEGEMLIATYSTDPQGVVRDDAFGSDGMMNLVDRLAVAEQALAGTPTDCGTAYGVLDVGIADAMGNRLVYSLRLVNSQELVPWGMHYRITVVNETPERIDGLHFRCSTTPTELHWPDNTPERVRERIISSEMPIVDFEVMPEHDLPTEAQMMQFHIYPNLPYTGGVDFVLRNRRMVVEAGTTGVPSRFRDFRNPCSVSHVDDATDP